MDTWKTAAVAGGLAYTHFHWLVRWMMRRIALKEGDSGDTTREFRPTSLQRVAPRGRSATVGVDSSTFQTWPSSGIGMPGEPRWQW